MKARGTAFDFAQDGSRSANNKCTLETLRLEEPPGKSSGYHMVVFFARENINIGGAP